MNNKVFETIKKYNMLNTGDAVIVGISGGADSCALLHYLCTLRDKMNVKIYACHVNHGIRGAEADKDENFTVEFCGILDVKLFTYHINIPEEARRRKIGEEQCGREVRYELFRKRATELNAKIATAHTASDNVETVLLNLTRGSGIKGLCGIPPVRDNIIRPLIEVSREDIELYCRENSILYVTDSTNLSRDYSRNKIRLDVIPVLREINPSLEHTVSGLSARLTEAEKYISLSAEAALSEATVKDGYGCKALSKLPDTVFAAAVKKLCAEFAVIPEAGHIELIRKIVYNGGAVEIKRGIFAVAKQGIFRIYTASERSEAPVSEVSLPNDGQTVSVCDKKITVSLINIEDYYNRKKIENKLFLFSLDYDTIPISAVFRTRRSGDIFSPRERGVTKTVKKLFCEMKIPSEKRDGIIMLADGNKVLWINGAGVSEKCRISEKTKRVMVIEVN